MRIRPNRSKKQIGWKYLKLDFAFCRAKILYMALLGFSAFPVWVGTAAEENLPPPTSPSPVDQSPVIEPSASPGFTRTPPPSLPQSQPLKPPASGIPAQTLRPSQSVVGFDGQLDRLERDRLVRERIILLNEIDGEKTGRRTFGQHKNSEFQKACREGAASVQECQTGVVVRWRGKSENQEPALQRPGDPQVPLPSASELAAIGFSEGGPQPLSTPLTVPVSALMAGADGSFSLSGVFAITPRPAPVAGNGNRSLLFPLIGPAAISSGFGFRLHPVLGSWLMHAGKDFAAPEGTPVVSALGGRVVSSGMAGGYGLTVEIEHDNPRRRTLYAHLSELFVKAGDRVRQGEVIGRVGSTGMSTGPHLHFELRLPQDGGWVAVDPGDLDPGPAGIGAGNDAIALLMGQLLQRLERPRVQAQASLGTPLKPQSPLAAPPASGAPRVTTD
jgi:murein DD-endopeptidase MepM/ murein hydrolase activator NlpD